MTASPSKSPSRGARIAAVIVLLGFFTILVLAQGSSPPPEPVSEPEPAATIEPESPGNGEPFHTPAPPDVTALLNGLSLGNEIDGWKVVSFNVMPEKVVWIELGNNGVYFSIGIATKGKHTTPPPVQTELYDLTYGMVRPRGTNIVPDVYTKLMEQIANRIRLREKEVAKPAAL